jgi:hypothetical protein
VYLYDTLSFPYLTHLILEAVQLPKISKFSKKKQLRRLTFTRSGGIYPTYDRSLPTSLQYLKLHGCKFQPLRELPLPSLLSLQEPRLHNTDTSGTFSDDRKPNELLRLGSQVTVLHLSGDIFYTRIAAFPRSLQLEEGWLQERNLGPICCLGSCF